MKFIAFVSLLFVGAAQASGFQTITCSAYNSGRQTTVVVEADSHYPSGLKLSVYRTVYGRAVPSETVEVQELPGTRGGVLAYADTARRKSLILQFAWNPSLRKSVLQGQFSDRSGPQTHEQVGCE